MIPMRDEKTSYCTECGWRAGTADGYTRDELTAATIDHYVETGHRIESDG